MQLSSIRFRLITSLVLVLVLGFVAINFLNYQVAKDSVRYGIINSSLPLTRDNIYSEIQSDLMRPIFVSSLMAHDTFLKDWTLKGEQDKNEIRRYLLEIKERYGFFSTFFVSESSANYYHFSGTLKQISKDDSHDVWYYDFTEAGKDYDLDVDADEAAAGSLTIFINHRLEGYDGSLLGVTGVGLKMEAVSRILNEYRRKYQRNIYLVDAAGVVQVHSDSSLIAKASLYDLAGISEHADAILDQDNGEKVYEYEAQDSHMLLAARYIPELNWFLIVEQDQNEALQTIKSNLFRNMGFAAVVIVLVIGINVFAVNYYQNKLVEIAVTDKLTGAFNRRELDFAFEKTLKVASRQSSPLCAILIDLDHFKEINDIHGHIAGDQVLKQVVALINQGMRGNDFLVRWGGDELMVLTPSSLEVASVMAERIRKGIEEMSFNDEGHPIRMTISGGVAEYHQGDSIDTLTRRCDEALYQAKRKGRNRVEASAADARNSNRTGS